MPSLFAWAGNVMFVLEWKWKEKSEGKMEMVYENLP